MKMIKRTLIILIIVGSIFTVVKCTKTEDTNNIKQEQGEDTLPEDDKKEEEENKDNQDKEKQDKDDELKEDQEKEEIESPVELG